MDNLIFRMPKPDEARYFEFLNLGFKYFPKRKENYEQFKNSNKKIEINYMPIKIDFDLISKCNLTCSLCQIETIRNTERANKKLSFSFFKDVIDEQYGLIEIKVQGIGEPFLNKDFIKMVEYASSKYIWVRSTTNGTLLHTNNNYKKIIDANIGELQISIDGAVKETFEKIRKGANFEQVCDNCKLINEYCEYIGNDRTRMWVVVQKENFDQIKLFPKFAKQLGFKRLTFSMDIHGWGQEKYDKMRKEYNVLNFINQQILNEILIASNEVGIDTTFYISSHKKFNKKNICFWPFERFFLSSNKKIVPCCIISNPDIYNFGDYKSFSRIWFGDKYKKFRKLHINGFIPFFCKYCYGVSEESYNNR